jgi:hypothetical protein
MTLLPPRPDFICSRVEDGTRAPNRRAPHRGTLTLIADPPTSRSSGQPSTPVTTASLEQRPRCLHLALSTLPPSSTAVSSPTQSPEVPRRKGLHPPRASATGSSVMETEPAWMEKYYVWREQQFSSSTMSKRRRATKEATVLAVELSSAGGRLLLGLGGVTGNEGGTSLGSNEVACTACKKNGRTVIVRTCLILVFFEFFNQFRCVCIITAS